MILLCTPTLHTQTPDSTIYRVGGGVSAPAVIYKVDPEYSEEARDAKLSGAVMLSTIIDASGRARDIQVVKSLGMGLDEKAIEAVEQWKFKPGEKDGQPVKVRATIEVNFVLLPPPITEADLDKARQEVKAHLEALTHQAQNSGSGAETNPPALTVSTPVNPGNQTGHPVLETGTVVSQQTVTVGSQTYQTLLHGWETRAKTENVVVVDAGAYRYTWVEMTRRWVILPVNGTIQFYRDKRVFVVTDDENHKHRFGLVAEEIRK